MQNSLQDRGQGRWIAAAVGLSFTLMLAPFLVTRLPPLVDYPDHLARFWLIAGGVRDPLMARSYSLDWGNAFTNVGIDWLIRWAAPFVSGLDAGRVVALAASILPPLGALALHRRVHGRASAWQALLPLAAWPATFLMGFLDFQIGLGLALLFAAADPLARGRAGGAFGVVRIAFGLGLIAVHLFAFGFYAALIAALAFGGEPLGPLTWRALWPRLRRATLETAWCAVPAILFLGFARALPAVATPGGFAFGTVFSRVRAIIAPLVGYDIPVELLLAAGLIVLVTRLARRRGLRVHGGLMVAAVILIVFSVAVPRDLGDSSWLNDRFPIMALLCALAGVELSEGLGAKAVRGVALAALALVAARAGWIGWNWRQMDPNLAAVRAVLAELPPGARLLPLQHRPTLMGQLTAPGRYMFNASDPTFGHYDALATPQRQAFVPTLFALRGKQPLVISAVGQPCAAPDGGRLASINELGRPPGPKDPRYMATWRQCFDHILVLNADLPDRDGPFRPPPGVTLVADRGFAQLWRIAPAK